MISLNSEKKLFLDVHVIQTVPPSNINRDDTGSPKTAQYGGAKRARVSSQSWKSAMRKYFCESVGEDSVGVRTLNIVSYLVDKIIAIDANVSREDAERLAIETFKNAGISTNDKKKAKALFFLSSKQAEFLAHAAIDGVKDKKVLQEIMKDNIAIDIALFGRMVADDPSLNEDASAQVAHAISTHSIQTEYDFFTAVDDLSPEDNAGAGMLGVVEFNASTLYRYGNIAIHELLKQLQSKEDTIGAVKLFVKAFSNSMPSGKINTFANNTVPQTVVVTLRSDRPVNLVSAFESPVKESKDGFVLQSINQLVNEYVKSNKFVDEAINTYFVAVDGNEDLSKIGEDKESLANLLKSLETVLEENIEE